MTTDIYRPDTLAVLMLRDGSIQITAIQIDPAGGNKRIRVRMSAMSARQLAEEIKKATDVLPE